MQFTIDVDDLIDIISDSLPSDGLELALNVHRDKADKEVLHLNAENDANEKAVEDILRAIRISLWKNINHEVESKCDELAQDFEDAQEEAHADEMMESRSIRG